MKVKQALGRDTNIPPFACAATSHAVQWTSIINDRWLVVGQLRIALRPKKEYHLDHHVSCDLAFC